MGSITSKIFSSPNFTLMAPESSGAVHNLAAEAGFRINGDDPWDIKVVDPRFYRRALIVSERHYDIGNDVFETMLDSTMSYSCGYWQHATTLEEAQRDKLDLICRKLKLQPGERLLDIGSRQGQLWKIVLSKRARSGVYRSVR